MEYASASRDHRVALSTLPYRGVMQVVCRDLLGMFDKPNCHLRPTHGDGAHEVLQSRSNAATRGKRAAISVGFCP